MTNRLPPLALPERLLGIDFSGGREAGRRIWITVARREAGRLLVEQCRHAESLPASGRTLERCLPALGRFIVAQGGAAVGLDFPFSLPAVLLAGYASWELFAAAFTSNHPHAGGFYAACRAQTGGKELRRRCDVESRTPFSVYNLRLYRQTHAGIGGLLAPLVRDAQVCVLPMQPPRSGCPWLLEVCPASVLKRLHLYRPYKGRTATHRAQRATIAVALGERCGVELAPAILPLLLDDPGGDALDSLIAAAGTDHALRDLTPSMDLAYALEGYVYT